MKPKLLAKIIKKTTEDNLLSIVDTLKNKPHSPLEKNSYKIAKSGLWVAFLSFLVSAAIGVWGIYFMWKSPDSAQIESLITKADAVLTKDSILLLMTAELHDMNAETANRNNYSALKKKFNRYNEIIFSFLELEQHVSIFDAQRKGKARVKIQAVRERLNRMDAVLNVLKDLHDIDELIPGHNLASVYGNCVTRLAQYKMLYTDNAATGGDFDTSTLGQKAFDTTMYNVIDFMNRALPFIEGGRIKTERDMNQIDSVMGVNNKIRDSIDAARNRKQS